MSDTTALLAFPMHGQHKLSNEGYRTRDGHLIEWFGRRLQDVGPVKVLSRPEPGFLEPFHRYAKGSVAQNTVPVSTRSWRIPSPRDRQRWWVTSARDYHRALPPASAPVVAWNPFLALSSAWKKIVRSGEPIAFDLLDDWSVHFAFAGIRKEVERAYAVMFEHAASVTANAEGTVELARRHGRSDVTLLTNGCDPDRFSSKSRATGRTTVGYVGKIGRRLDLDLILATARALPDVDFVFAGPVLDAEYRQPMTEMRNLTMLGDVHYEAVPELLTTFDLGWVPHRVGDGEVGGDVIKTYEYRAAGLPVLSTPVSGANSRGLDAVSAIPARDHEGAIRAYTERGSRIPRVETPLPDAVRWSGKADLLLRRLGLAQ